VIRQQYWFTPLAGPGLFSATQRAARTLTGRDAGYYPPLTWPCPGCGQQITDLAACGRPVHSELGRSAGCTRLAQDQAADETLRRDWPPRLALHSEDPVGPVQRHWLAGPIIDDCPRCVWHGYFHRNLITVDGDWTRTLRDNCYADLHPDIMVTVKFFSASQPRGSEPFAVIRQRTRSDHDYPGLGLIPDLGQQMTWQLYWEHTTKLADENHGGADADITEISRDQAEQITAGLAGRCGRRRQPGCPGSPPPTRDDRPKINTWPTRTEWHNPAYGGGTPTDGLCETTDQQDRDELGLVSWLLISPRIMDRLVTGSSNYRPRYGWPCLLEALAWLAVFAVT
jgi:hypothetical protein